MATSTGPETDRESSPDKEAGEESSEKIPKGGGPESSKAGTRGGGPELSKGATKDEEPKTPGPEKKP